MELEYPAEWDDLPAKLSAARVIVMLGGTDTGKSTFIRYLAGRCLERGEKVALINTDVGQADVGPPAAMASAFIEKSFTSYSELAASRLAFVGSTSPSGHCFLCLAALARLLGEVCSSNADHILINTTGWITGGEAWAYKCAKLELISPDAIVALHSADELQSLLDYFRRLTRPSIHALAASGMVKIRDAEERTRSRKEKYRAYFEGSRLHLLDTLKLTVTRMGFPQSYTLACTTLSNDEFMGRMAGFYDARHACLGLGIIRGVEEKEPGLLVQVHGEVMKKAVAIRIGDAVIEEG